MKLYLIRHGESVGNQMNVHQFDNTELSQLGQLQAYATGMYLRMKDIDALITSDMARAKQTADIIGEKLHMHPQVTNLLREMRRPTAIQGKPVDDPMVVQIKDVMFDHAEDPAYHYSDEENFHEFKMRVKQALEYLVSLERKKIAAITHGYVIRMMVIITMLDDYLKPSYIEPMRARWEVGPGSITVLELNEKNVWNLLAWNDTSHLDNLPKGAVY